MRTLTCLLAFAVGLAPGLVAAAPRSAPVPASASGNASSTHNLNLPKLGLAGGPALPIWKAQFMGRVIYREIQGTGAVVNDPLVADYVNHLGHRLSSVAHGPDEPYHYYVIDAPIINAFAVPGAYIAVFSRLMLVTRNEDELAGVLAHETAHIALRHTARSMADSSYNNLINLGILIAGVIATVAGAGPAGIAAAEGGIMQRNLNYTRADEMEADHVGIDILARAKFKPQGMINFFEYMQRNYAMQGYNIPEFLSSHPLDLTRISEAQIRAKNLHVKPKPENPNYALMRARLRVLVSTDPKQVLEYFKMRQHSADDDWYKTAAVYGTVLSLNRLNEGEQALKLIAPLAKKHPNNIALNLAKAQALLTAGHKKQALADLADYNTLFNSSKAVTLAYATALFHNGQAKKVVGLLAPGLRNKTYRYNPKFSRLLARAANQTEQTGLAYLAMAHYYLDHGRYHPAITQLRLGLRQTHLTPVQRQNLEDLKKSIEDDYKRAKRMGLVQERRDGR
jgi:predicted Zn-dependent protease